MPLLAGRSIGQVGVEQGENPRFSGECLQDRDLISKTSVRLARRSSRVQDLEGDHVVVGRPPRLPDSCVAAASERFQQCPRTDPVTGCRHSSAVYAMVNATFKSARPAREQDQADRRVASDGARGLDGVPIASSIGSFRSSSCGRYFL